MATMAVNAGQELPRELRMFDSPAIGQLLSSPQETVLPGGTILYGDPTIFGPQGTLPVGTVVRNQREPWNRIALRNGVTTPITQVVIDQGTWLIYGGATVQDTGFEGVDQDNHFLYTMAAFAPDPSFIPIKGHTGLDARHYAKYWWFAASPVTHSVRINSGAEFVYLLVQSYGGIPPRISECFGSEGALKVAQ